MNPSSAGSTPPRLLVTVGTDHHPFDRLMGWIEDWLASAAGRRVECTVQHGRSRAPLGARVAPYLSGEELRAEIARSTAVISHGGPSTIMECRWAGLRPIVVPRRAMLGEHVDDHQVVFTTRLAEAGMITMVDTPAGLHEALFQAMLNPDSVRVQPALHTCEATVGRVGILIGELLQGRGTAVSGRGGRNPAPTKRLVKQGEAPG